MLVVLLGHLVVISVNRLYENELDYAKSGHANEWRCQSIVRVQHGARCDNHGESGANANCKHLVGKRNGFWVLGKENGDSDRVVEDPSSAKQQSGSSYDQLKVSVVPYERCEDRHEVREKH